MKQLQPYFSTFKLGRPPLTLKLNEINTTPLKEVFNIDRLEKKSDYKPKVSQSTANSSVQNSNKKTTKRTIIETDIVIQEFEKLKLKTLQRIQKNQIVQISSDPKVLRDQIYEQIYALIGDNLKYGKSTSSLLEHKKQMQECTCQTKQNTSMNDSSFCISNFSSVAHNDYPLQISTLLEDVTTNQLSLQSEQEEINKLKQDNAQLQKQKELEFILTHNLLQQMKKQSIKSNLDYELQLQQQDSVLQHISKSISQKNKSLVDLLEEEQGDSTIPINPDNYQAVNPHQKSNNGYNQQQYQQNIDSSVKSATNLMIRATNTSQSSSPHQNNVKEKHTSEGGNSTEQIDQVSSEIIHITQVILNRLSSIEKALGQYHPETKNIKVVIQNCQLREKLQQDITSAQKTQINSLQKQLVDSTMSTWNTRLSSDSNEGNKDCMNQQRERTFISRQDNQYDQLDQNSDTDIQERLSNIYHKENALRRRYALLKKKEINISLNEKKLQARIQHHSKDSKLLDEKTKHQCENEKQLNQLWQDLFKEIERIFKQIYQPQAESNNPAQSQSQQAIISIQKVQTMIQGYISKTNTDKSIIAKEREVIQQLRRELESQRKELEMERFEFYSMVEMSNKDNDIRSKYASLQSQQ